MGEEFKSEGVKPNVSTQVSLTVPEKTSGRLLRGPGTCRRQGPPSALPRNESHTGTARLPDSKLSEPRTSCVVLGRLLALAPVLTVKWGWRQPLPNHGVTGGITATPRSAHHQAWHTTGTQQLLLLAAARFFPVLQLQLLSSQWESRAEGRAEGLQVKAGPHAALAFVASETGQMDAPRSLATSPGREPRLRGPPRAPAHFYNVGSKNSWILYPSCVLAVPLKCQGRVLAALAAPDSSYLSMCSLGCKALFRRAGCFPNPQGMAAAQPDLLSCKSRSCTPA